MHLLRLVSSLSLSWPAGYLEKCLIKPSLLVECAVKKPIIEISIALIKKWTNFLDYWITIFRCVALLLKLELVSPEVKVTVAKKKLNSSIQFSPLLPYFLPSAG